MTWSSRRQIPGKERWRAVDYICPRLPDYALGSSRLIYPVPRLLFLSTPSIADLQSFASHQAISQVQLPATALSYSIQRPIRAEYSLVPCASAILCNLFLTAPLGDVHIQSSHVSCGRLDLRAETSITHWLHCTLYDQRNPRSTPRGQYGKVHLVKGACNSQETQPRNLLDSQNLISPNQYSLVHQGKTDLIGAMAVQDTGRGPDVGLVVGQLFKCQERRGW